jgi:hypothetical protein
MRHWLGLTVTTIVALALVATACSKDEGTTDAGACPSGQTSCGGKCTNVKEDPENCGACGTVCPTFSICDLASCVGMGDAAARTDASSDAASLDAADAPSDGPTDASVDVAMDAANDAPADAPSDAPADAPPGDAAADTGHD